MVPCIADFQGYWLQTSKLADTLLIAGFASWTNNTPLSLHHFNEPAHSTRMFGERRPSVKDGHTQPVLWFWGQNISLWSKSNWVLARRFIAENLTVFSYGEDQDFWEETLIIKMSSQNTAVKIGWSSQDEWYYELLTLTEFWKKFFVSGMRLISFPNDNVLTHTFISWVYTGRSGSAVICKWASEDSMWKRELGSRAWEDSNNLGALRKPVLTFS
jgi:hypothetical protein